MADSTEEVRSVELAHYGRVVRRRWYVVVAGVVLGLGAAGLFLAVVPRTATATAMVNINVISSQPFDSGKPDSQLFDPETEVQIAQSSQVLGKVVQTLGDGETLSEVRQNTAVQPLTSATVVRLSFSAPSEALAIRGANAIAENYLAYRSDAASTKVSKVVDRLEAQRADLRTKLIRANRRLADSKPGDPLAVVADSDRQLVSVELNSLVGQLNQFDSVDTSGGTLISGAGNDVVVGPSSTMLMGAGLLLGLFGGLVLAFVVHRLDRRIYDERGVGQAGGGVVLSQLRGHTAMIPATGGDLDAILSLRERLLVSVPSGGNLIVADLTRHAWPSDVGANLAVAVAQGHDRIVRLVLPDHSSEYIDHLGRVLDLQQIAAEDGVVSYASGAAPNLRVTTMFGAGQPDTRSSIELARGLSRESSRTQLMTVVSLPPAATRSLRLAAGRLGHSNILVVSRLSTRSGAIAQLAGELEAVDAVVHGSVLVPRKRVRPKMGAPARVRESAHSQAASNRSVPAAEKVG